jgi:hypothetical protein
MGAGPQWRGRVVLGRFGSECVVLGTVMIYYGG